MQNADRGAEAHLDGSPLLNEFLEAARARKAKR